MIARKTDKTPTVRLFVAAPLNPGVGVGIELSPDQAHYLRTVMRLPEGSRVILFNGRDGEWTAELAALGKKSALVRPIACTRPQADDPAADLWLLFAPLKGPRTDLVAEKATELGVSVLWPVMTRRTVAARVNLARMAANAREAAEQSERLSVPDVREATALNSVLEEWDRDRRLFVLMERGDAIPAAEAFTHLGPVAILVGPEGGFDPDEAALIARRPFAVPVSLGTGILRAETAAIAALACRQAIAGDWRRPRDGDTNSSKIEPR